MSLKSVYLPELASLKTERLIRIGGDEFRHLIVARAEIGEGVELFDGKGEVWKSTVVALNKKDVQVEVISRTQIERDAQELVLGLALIRASAFELAVEKAVEIGVTRICPFAAKRSNAPAPRRLDRLEKIIVEAAKQSKRYLLPKIEDPVAFDRILETSTPTKIVFAERGGGPLKSALAGWPATYLIGPEGGWTDEELERFQEHGFSSVSLGSGILKAETAAIVGGALIRYEMGLR